MKKARARFSIGGVRALAAILLAPLLAFGAVSFAIGIAGGVSREPAKPSSLIWSHQVFTSQKDLATWLAARGRSYETWTVRHPSLASVFATPESPPAAPSTTRRGPLLRGALATAMALLLLLAVTSPRMRYRRPARAGRQRPRRERATPTFAAARATAAFATQSGSSASPYLRSFVDAGRQSMSDIHHALSTPHGRRTTRAVLLYTAYVVCAIALGTLVAIYFP